MRVALLTLGLVATPAVAGTKLQGDHVRIYFDDDGLWNDTTVPGGYQLSADGARWIDVTYPGAPYQVLGFAFDGDCGRGVVESCRYKGDYLKVDWEVLSVADTSSGDVRELTAEYQVGPLEVTAVTSWPAADRAVLVTLAVGNTSALPVTNLRITWGADPDHDTAAGSYATTNDVFGGETGWAWASASGATTHVTVGVGVCDEQRQIAGIGTNSTDIDEPLEDPDGATADLTLKLRTTQALLPPAVGTDPVVRVKFPFLVVWGADADAAWATYESSAWRCEVGDDSHAGSHDLPTAEDGGEAGTGEVEWASDPAPPTDDGLPRPGDDTGLAPGEVEEGCGCASAPGGAWLGVFALLLLFRRRSG